ncbi:MAG: hypothetical protein IPK80_03095 [Nannocystis sp.]|nr:hypothetical protein [Nannocystis sp.]
MTSTAKTRARSFAQPILRGPLLGDRRLDALGERDLVALKARLLDLAPSSAAEVLKTLKALLHRAVKLGHLARPPLEIQIPRRPRKEPVAYSADETAARRACRAPWRRCSREGHLGWSAGQGLALAARVRQRSPRPGERPREAGRMQRRAPCPPACARASTSRARPTTPTRPCSCA